MSTLQPRQRTDRPVYYYERGPGDNDEVLRVACWCEERAVRAPKAMVGVRTNSCGSRKCVRMNDEYESRAR